MCSSAPNSGAVAVAVAATVARRCHMVGYIGIILFFFVCHTFLGLGFRV